MPDGSNITADYEELQDFLDDLASKQKTITEATGSLRSRLKGILDETGYHKGAFGMIRQIDNLSDTARADFLRTFEPLFDAMLSGKWRDAMQDMMDGVNEQDGDE